MKILVIGSRGNMGRRYMAILKYLSHEAIGIDMGDKVPSRNDYDKAIIATQTESHYIWYNVMIGAKKDFLCEKPLDTDVEMIEEAIMHCNRNGIDGRMVCNWAFCMRTAAAVSLIFPEKNVIRYNNYNTGKDGLAWDCIQLIYLAKGFPELKSDFPMLDCLINGTRVDEGHIAQSYVDMVRQWIEDPSKLWSLEDAKKASEKVIRYMEVNK